MQKMSLRTPDPRLAPETATVPTGNQSRLDDFLWRTSRDLPERGRIGIFNRSYYEEVLIVRVHPEILRSEAIPDTPHHDKEVWHDRYRSIVDLEKHLHRNGTRIIKFFLHLSKEEQRKRFLARIDEPEKNWKFSAADIAERDSGSSTSTPMRNASVRQAPVTRPGMSFPPTIKRTLG